ncbi:hypothetical protein C8R46DRAFT_389175 [Mycena filopes]|nr:hypothetical protein C8R46DRAFT_389175 [Mycena filopes]
MKLQNTVMQLHARSCCAREPARPARTRSVTILTWFKQRISIRDVGTSCRSPTSRSKTNLWIPPSSAGPSPSPALAEHGLAVSAAVAAVRAVSPLPRRCSCHMLSEHALNVSAAQLLVLLPCGAAPPPSKSRTVVTLRPPPRHCSALLPVVCAGPPSSSSGAAAPLQHALGDAHLLASLPYDARPRRPRTPTLPRLARSGWSAALPVVCLCASLPSSSSRAAAPPQQARSGTCRPAVLRRRAPGAGRARQITPARVEVEG